VAGIEGRRRRMEWEAARIRRRRRRLALVAIGLAALLSVVLSTEVFGGDDPCRGPDAAPGAETALLPAGLSFDQVGTVTRVRKANGYVMAKAVTTKPLDEATVLIQDAVTAAGYRPAGMDNEGFEAEVFFTSGPHAGGQARLEQSGCEGRWDVDLVLLDRNAKPFGTTPTTTTP
jgi:hypothetical protein